MLINALQKFRKVIIDKRTKELLEKSGEILFIENKMYSLLKAIQNSIQYSMNKSEDISYIVTGCDVLQNLLVELIHKTDSFERSIIN